MIEVGEKIKALHDSKFDRVTKDKVYEVTKVQFGMFHILNDEGYESLPITTSFTRVQKTNEKGNE